jgi:hypothetical protein
VPSRTGGGGGGRKGKQRAKDEVRHPFLCWQTSRPHSFDTIPLQQSTLDRTTHALTLCRVDCCCWFGSTGQPSSLHEGGRGGSPRRFEVKLKSNFGLSARSMFHRQHHSSCLALHTMVRRIWVVMAKGERGETSSFVFRVRRETYRTKSSFGRSPPRRAAGGAALISYKLLLSRPPLTLRVVSTGDGGALLHGGTLVMRPFPTAPSLWRWLSVFKNMNFFLVFAYTTARLVPSVSF